MSRRPITAEDLRRFLFPGDPQLSPDGRSVVYTVKSIDEAEYRQHLWLDAEQYTRGKVFDSLPRWSPDGESIAFVRSAGAGSQIWLAPRAGGEPRALTALPLGKVRSLEWSPDASRLAFGFRKDPGNAPLLRRITRLRHKEEGKGFFDGEREHIWTASRDGRARQLTRGEWDDLQPAWSPDGRRLAFVSSRLPDADYRVMEQELWVLPVAPSPAGPPSRAPSGKTLAPGAAGGRARKLPKPPGPAAHPQWSPDGRKIAYLGHDKPESSWGATNSHPWVVDSGGGRPARDLLPGFDRSCEDLVITDTKSFHGGHKAVWSEDGKKLYFLASDSGSCHLHSVAAKGGEPRRLTKGRREIMGFSTARGRFALAVSDPLNIGDIYDFRPGKEPRRLSSLNSDLFSGLRLSAPEPFDTGVQGWLIKPPGFTPRKKYPLILQIHGGPRALYGNAFFHEFQLLAAQGYLVLYCNPRGSQGYGERFAEAIREDWGNLDYRDLMNAVDRAAALPYVDAKRLGVCGGSYGGYMTNWIVGHTRRFKAAITMRSVTNLFSMYGTSDFGYEDHREFGRHAFDDPGRYARLSPISYVRDIRTPLLIIHSEQDLRCPIEQAEQLFTMLKALKRPVEFLRFPEECHDLSRTGRPDRRLARLEHILRWWRRRL